MFTPVNSTNPFIVKGRTIDKTDIRNALVELDRKLHDVMEVTETAIRTESIHDEIRWATDISGLEITMTNIAEMIRTRFM